MSSILLYDQARSALMECQRIDEAKDIADKAEAMRAYARQAKDPDMEIAMAEIRLRAMRRIGELSKQLEKATSRHESTLPSTGKRKSEVLASAGLSTSQAHRCEQVAGLDDEAFENTLATARATGKPITADYVASKLVGAQKREQTLSSIVEGSRAVPLGQLRKYPLLYADPPWSYDFAKTDSRNLANQYPTMSLDEIAALEVPAAESCVCFLWATAPLLVKQLGVLEAWGFEYKSHLVWDKQRVGMGFWTRVAHELLLIGTRGSIPTPAEACRPGSVVSAPRGAHSEKPHLFREIIDGMYPELRGDRLEMFARERVEGWDAWGHEV